MSYCNSCRSYRCSCKKSCNNCGCLFPSTSDCLTYSGTTLTCLDIHKGDVLTEILQKMDTAICEGIVPASGNTYVLESCDANIEVTTDVVGTETTFTVCLSSDITDQLTEIEADILVLQACCDDSISSIISNDGSIYVSDEGSGVWNIQIANPSGDVFTNGSGQDSITRTAYMGVASGIGSFNFGDSTSSISGDYSFGGGFAISVTGDYSGAFGNSVGASGDYAYSFGSTSVASGDYSFATGLNAIASKHGQFSISSGANTQISQKSNLLARRNTTNATPSILYLDGASLLPTILSNSSVYFEGSITAVQLSGTNPSGNVGDTATWKFYGTIKNIAGTTSIVDNVIYLDGIGQTFSNIATQFAQDANAAAWDVDISADDVNDALQIQVTGEVNKNILWHCEMMFNELKYAT